MVRLIQTEAMLWASPRKSEPASPFAALGQPALGSVSEGLALGPAQMQTRWAERKRPVPPEIAWAQAHYSEVQRWMARPWMH